MKTLSLLSALVFLSTVIHFFYDFGGLALRQTALRRMYPVWRVLYATPAGILCLLCQQLATLCLIRYYRMVKLDYLAAELMISALGYLTPLLFHILYYRKPVTLYHGGMLVLCLIMLLWTKQGWGQNIELLRLF